METNWSSFVEPLVTRSVELALFPNEPAASEFFKSVLGQIEKEKANQEALKVFIDKIIDTFKTQNKHPDSEQISSNFIKALLDYCPHGSICESFMTQFSNGHLEEEPEFKRAVSALQTDLHALLNLATLSSSAKRKYTHLISQVDEEKYS